jgi:hypothetical protein
MALVSGSPEMSLLVRNRVGSNPTLIIILLFCPILACSAILGGWETYNFVFGCEDFWWGSRAKPRNFGREFERPRRAHLPRIETGRDSFQDL